MHLSLGNFQIDAFKYFRALHVGVQIFNDQTHDDERELALRRGDGTPQGDLGFFHAHVVGQVDEFLQFHAFLDGDVVNASGPGVLEVSVLNEIGTETGRTAFKVDLIDQAVVHQRLQAVINGGQGDAGEFMEAMAAEGNSMDVLFMDPPRAGSDEKFMASAVKMGPEKIVYISCNPETLARDLKYLTKKGYQVKKIQPVEMFAFTEHVETVVLLSR